MQKAGSRHAVLGLLRCAKHGVGRTAHHLPRSLHMPPLGVCPTDGHADDVPPTERSVGEEDAACAGKGRVGLGVSRRVYASAKHEAAGHAGRAGREAAASCSRIHGPRHQAARLLQPHPPVALIVHCSCSPSMHSPK